ncbi:Uncharacterised protein (plasmid) [Tsukamurella tyrosinosolvens]|uniref:Uncharacterized protein n=1 Tax=Tsukamurella tyrosinosolvens TaxID=57704 RepID=A0A1H4V9I8_TSUTY|nr:hypothetical protein [Tsukamurella tyrosinosolvens]KXO91019.1 hypothetical protein AXK58_21555 [Tsukamurella tyrosinosolvens]SEC77603.1 hypothetical protein SAMN04489793_3178 [Tsukamurella tyrosinosolvens]VEH90618.1 Uncharacterised protein [Tsukamurella tyrosinosolvens]
MSGRLNYTPYDANGAGVSVLAPGDPNYREDAESFGVEDPAGEFIVGIGDDYPDVVLTGDRDQLINVFREALKKLGA